MYAKLASAAAIGLTLAANAVMTGPAAANDPSYSTGTRIQLGDMALPKCRTAGGRDATYVVTTAPGLATPFAYSVTKYNGAPVPFGIPQSRGHYIVIPQQFVARNDHNTALFAVSHECAHHELGHTARLDDSTTLAQIQHFEREADCLAPAILMQDYGLSGEKTAQVIRHAFSSRMMRDYDRVRDPAHATHDSSEQRYANTMACLRTQLRGLTQ